jgi:hypothetical protein
MKIQRAANDPSFDCSRELLVSVPRPDQARGSLPLASAMQRELGVAEASKVSDQQLEASSRRQHSTANATDPD